MRKQDQTVHGEGTGNCLATCIACVLDVDVALVPNFCATWRDWQEVMNEWLSEHFGLSILTVTWPPGDRLLAFPRGGDVILSGPSPRFQCMHSVVGTVCRESGEPQMQHDPHPSREGLKRIKELDYFVVVDAERFRSPVTPSSGWFPPPQYATPKARKEVPA